MHDVVIKCFALFLLINVIISRAENKDFGKKRNKGRIKSEQI